MTALREDQMIRAFLHEGQSDLPERTYVAVRMEIERTRQRPAPPAWARLRQQTLLRIALAAVLVAVVVAGFELIQGPIVTGPGNTPQPPPSEPPSEPPIVLPATTGPLAAGSYFTNPIDPIVPIPITVTLPEGWNNAGWALSKNGSNISFWTVTETYTDPCHWSTTALDPPLGPSVDDLVTALRQQLSSNTTAPATVTLGERNGQRVELDWPDLDADTCDRGEYRIWVFGEDASRGNTMGVHATIWILDVDGLRVVIEADSRPNARAEQLVEVESVIASIRFDVPEGGVSVGSCTLTLSGLDAQSTSPPYSVTIQPGTVEPPAAEISAGGSGWGQDGPGRPVVSLRQPDGTQAFPGVGLGGGDLTTSFALDSAGRWVLSIRAESVGCVQMVPIDVVVTPETPGPT